jgi:hypothetical protein
MTNPECETADKAEYLKARIHHAVASGGPGIVIFAILVLPRKSSSCRFAVGLWLIKTLWR